MNGLAVFLVIATLGQVQATGSSFGWKELESGRLAAVVHISPETVNLMSQPDKTGRPPEISVEGFTPDLAALVDTIIIRIDRNPAERIPSIEDLKRRVSTRDRNLYSLDSKGISGGYKNIDNAPPNLPALGNLAQATNSLRDRDSDSIGSAMKKDDPRSLSTLQTPPPSTPPSTFSPNINAMGSGMTASASFGDSRNRDEPTPPASMSNNPSPFSQPASTASTGGLAAPTSMNSGFAGAGVNGSFGSNGLTQSGATANNYQAPRANQFQNDNQSNFASNSGFGQSQTNPNPFQAPASVPAYNPSRDYQAPPSWSNPPPSVPQNYAQGPTTAPIGNGFQSVANQPGPFARTADSRMTSTAIDPRANTPPINSSGRVGNQNFESGASLGGGLAGATDPYPPTPRSFDQTFLPILFLFSFVGNIYLWIWIARLRDRYRALLASVRSTSVA